MSVILFLFILAILVLVHEFGHFFAAKKLGIRVDEFGLGFPPRVFSWKRGETVYSLNAIPFGGYVKIFGESPDEESLVGPDAARSFVKKPKWAQATVLIAGIFCNVVFAWLLFAIAFTSGMTTSISDQNQPYIDNPHILVTGILPDSPAAQAGIKAGDTLIAYRSSSATTTVTSIESVQEAILLSGGAPVGFLIKKELGELSYIEVLPSHDVFEDKYAIGISMDHVGNVELPVHLAAKEAAVLTGNIFAGIFTNLYHLIADAFSGDADLSGISGPVGIAGLVGDASKLGFVYLMSFTAFISLNLAVLNLIPFPALDGGRIVFVLIEAVIRRPIPPRIANLVNATGFGILILFMLFITYRDIIKLF